MSRSKRKSPQVGQEQISRSQFMTRISKYGWTPFPIFPDLGEDFLIRIDESDSDVSLDFYVQIKSTQDIGRLKLNGSHHISYKFKTKDLTHWYNLHTPTILLIWDINVEMGYWVAVSSVVKELDGYSKGWRTQETVTVRFPTGNDSNDNGLNSLKQVIADYYYPLLVRDKTLELSFKAVFPNTPKGVDRGNALRRFFDAGDPVEIDGEYIEKIEFSKWWTALYGPIDPKTGKLILGPSPSKESIPIRIDVFTEDKEAMIIPYVDFRVVKGGMLEVTISNTEQPIPLKFDLVFRKDEKHFGLSFRLANMEVDAQQARDCIAIWQALANGGIIRFTYLSNNKYFDGKLPKNSLNNVDPNFVDLINKLCMIERKTNTRLIITDWSINREDAETINDLIAVFNTGRSVTKDKIFSIDIKKPGLEIILRDWPADGIIHFRRISEEASANLLGVQIPMGHYIQYISGSLNYSVNELKQLVEKMQPDGTLTIKVNNAKVVDEFAKWLPNRSQNLETRH